MNATQTTRRKQGDVTRKRRLSGLSGRQQWYAYYRSIRFNRRLGLSGLSDLGGLDQLVHQYQK